MNRIINSNIYFQDVRSAITFLHSKGDLKDKTLENLDYYIKKNPLIPKALSNISKSGAKVFLLTNSDYDYTNRVMEFLFDFPYGETPDKPHRSWQTYFDVIIVDGCKPLFFGEGTVLRQVDEQTGKIRLGTHVGEFQKGHIYSGGCCDVFMQLTKAKGHEVLYFGDHVYGDILRSKKSQGWRTFLIIPELIHELNVWTKRCQLFDELQHYDMILGDVYKNMDSSTSEKPDISAIREAIRDVTYRLDMSYGLLGSVFRFGSRLTFLSNQTQRFADLYSASFYNIIYYPLSYMFRAPATLMPHESTVAHESECDLVPLIKRERTESLDKLYSKSLLEVNNVVPNIMPPIPLTIHVTEDGGTTSEPLTPEHSKKLAELKQKWAETEHKITFTCLKTVPNYTQELDIPGLPGKPELLDDASLKGSQKCANSEVVLIKKEPPSDSKEKVLDGKKCTCRETSTQTGCRTNRAHK